MTSYRFVYSKKLPRTYKPACENSIALADQLKIKKFNTDRINKLIKLGHDVETAFERIANIVDGALFTTWYDREDCHYHGSLKSSPEKELTNKSKPKLMAELLMAIPHETQN